MRLTSKEQRWYNQERDNLKMWLDEARTSMMPHAPLGLATAILDCIKLRVINNDTLEKFQTRIDYWKGRINVACRRYGPEVMA